MYQHSQTIRDIAQQLVEIGQDDAAPQSHAVIQVCEKLRSCLTQFAGADGFASLMRRALALASKELSSLDGITVGHDGRLKGIDPAVEKATLGRAEAIAIATELLGLLVTFVGEPLTLKLVRDSCIDNTPDKSDLKCEATDDRS